MACGSAWATTTRSRGARSCSRRSRELKKDRISGWRWFLGAWGVGTYRQDDSVDVRYERADGTPAVAEKLDIELRP